MNSPELFIISTLKALVEIAALSLLAQGAVGLFSGQTRQQNVFYRLFQTVTDPVVKAVRYVTPRFVAEIHLPLITFLILFWMWLLLIYAKASVCHAQHLACFSR